MSVKNSYPELPEISYLKTSVNMDDVVAYLKSLNISKTLKVAAYVMFRNESGNGRNGVNNNYLGIQADSGRWAADTGATGTVVKSENMTGSDRRFLAFADFKGSIDFLINRINDRQLYVGGTCNKIVKMPVNSVSDWTIAYWRSWVTGNQFSVIPPQEQRDLISMYTQGEKLFGE